MATLTRFKDAQVYAWCPVLAFSTPEPVHARTPSEPTLTHLTAALLTAYSQPSNRVPPCLVQGTLIHPYGLLLKRVPVIRVFLVNMLNWLSVLGLT